MSYEGYVQALCQRGHYNTFDAYDDDDKSCYDQHEGQRCGEPYAWRNSVNDTNCDSYGQVLIRDLTVVAEAKVDVCPHCSATKVLDDKRYAIPTPEQTKALRTHMPQYGNGPTLYIQSGEVAVPAPPSTDDD